MNNFLRRNGVLVLLLIVTGILVSLMLAKNNGSQVALGAWMEGFWDAKAKTLHPETLKQFEGQIGKKVAIAHIYRGWHEIDSEDAIAELKAIDANGWTPLLSANPYYFDRCKHSNYSLYETIGRGDCDEFLHSMSARLASYGKPVLFRFAWEMNIKTNEWSIPYSASKPEEFVKAWRHIHTIMSEEGADNVKWVFCPQVSTAETVPYTSLYAGDEYVDWIALDGYNWGTTQSWSRWQSFSEVFGKSYDELTAIAPAKPVMIAEFGTTDMGGDKPLWFTDMFKELPVRFPRVKALVFYNEDRSQEEQSNWKIDSPAGTVEAVRQGVESDRYSPDLD